MSLVDEVLSFRQRIAQRLDELEPLVREYNELKQIAAEMGLENPGPEAAVPGASGEPAEARAASTAPRARRAEARAGATSEPGRTPATRRANTGRRGEAAELGRRMLDAVRADPGKTVADYADVLGVAPSVLYRPVRELTTQGALVKRARQLFPD